MKRFLMTGLLVIFAATAFADEISPSDLSTLRKSDVIILGEVHDNPVHHLHQAQAIASLAPTAVVFEMLTPEQAKLITVDNRSDAADLASGLGWAASGWPDFAIYYPVFKAAGDAAVFGGNLPRSDVRRAIREGAVAVFGAGAQAYGLTEPLTTPEQTEREAGQREAHCNALPEDLLAGMVEAQRLRDAVLADAVLKAWRATGGPVVLITGNGHARRDSGVPAMLAKAAPDLSVLSIGQYEESAPADPPFDLYLVTPAAEREDPCLAFRKG